MNRVDRPFADQPDADCRSKVKERNGGAQRLSDGRIIGN